MKWTVELFGSWLTVCDMRTGKFLIQVDVSLFTDAQLGELLVVMFQVGKDARP